MEYYCVMVRTGQEESFKKTALEELKPLWPELELYFFRRTLRTNQGKCFDAPLFPSYLFLGVNAFSAEFYQKLRHINDFCRILYSNPSPTVIQGKVLEELKLFISHGENWGISKVQFLPGKRVRAVSGPMVGLEGQIYKVNKKKKHITIISSLSPDGKKFDLLYDDVELV